MGVPDEPRMALALGAWHRLMRVLAIYAAGLALVPANAMAQSTEITKTYNSGQSEIRKSQPPPNAAPDVRTEATIHRVAPAQEPVPEAGGVAVTATQAEVTKERGLTRFALQLSAPVRYHVSSMANPYRIVLDLPDVDFRLPVAAGQQGQGLVRAYRYGLLAPGKARVVIDTTQPVRVQKHAIAAHAAGNGVRLSLDLAPTDESTFLAGVAAPPALRQHEPPGGDDARPAPPPRAANGRPVVVIDPGH